jgi:hypothetical protein
MECGAGEFSSSPLSGQKTELNSEWGTLHAPSLFVVPSFPQIFSGGIGRPAAKDDPGQEFRRKLYGVSQNSLWTLMLTQSLLISATHTHTRTFYPRCCLPTPTMDNSQPSNTILRGVPAYQAGKVLKRTVTRKQLFQAATRASTKDARPLREEPALDSNAQSKRAKLDHCFAQLSLDDVHTLVTDYESGEVLVRKATTTTTKPTANGLRPRAGSTACERQTLVVVEKEDGERVVVRAQARAISLERERVLRYDSADSLEQRGFMVIRNHPHIRWLADSIAANPQCNRLDPELSSTKFFIDDSETADLLEIMTEVLDDTLGASSVELAEEATARVRVGPAAAFPRVHKDLQSCWRPKGRGRAASTAHGASANIFNVWIPLAKVTETDCPLGLVPTSNTLVAVSSPRSARKLFQCQGDREVFHEETFTLGKHNAQKLQKMEYFPSMQPGDMLLFKSDAVFHAALNHLSCQHHGVDAAKTCNCHAQCGRKSMDVRLFVR